MPEGADVTVASAPFSNNNFTKHSVLSSIISLKQVLATAKTIKGLASATTVNFHISGVEIS